MFAIPGENGQHGGQDFLAGDSAEQKGIQCLPVTLSTPERFDLINFITGECATRYLMPQTIYLLATKPINVKQTHRC